MPPETLIQTQHLSQVLEGQIHLSDINLEVPAGVSCGIYGPPHSGKTVLLRLLLGIERPSAGRAQLFDLDTIRQGLEIRQRVGYVPQTIAFDAWMSVTETVRLAGRLRFHSQFRRIEDRAIDLLTMVGLNEMRQVSVSRLSFLQKKRLALAIACLHQPELLVLDEPSDGLTEVEWADLRLLLLDLRRVTRLMVATSRLDDAVQLADYLVVLSNHKLLAHGPADRLSQKAILVYSLTLSGDVAHIRGRLEGTPGLRLTRVRQSVDPIRGPLTTFDFHLLPPHLEESYILNLVLAPAAGEPENFRLVEFRRSGLLLDENTIQTALMGAPVHA